MSAAGALAAGLVALAASPVAARGAPPVIDPLNTRWNGPRLIVSYRVSNGLSEEVLERVQSGIPITFRHRVEIVKRRTVPLWPARVASRTLVEATAAYDSLTRRYDLSRTTEAHQAGDEAVVLEQRHSTDSEDEMRAWMTEFPETSVFDRSRWERGSRLRLRAESALGRRFVLLIFPATATVSAELKLEP